MYLTVELIEVNAPVPGVKSLKISMIPAFAPLVANVLFPFPELVIFPYLVVGIVCAAVFEKLIVLVFVVLSTVPVVGV